MSLWICAGLATTLAFADPVEEPAVDEVIDEVVEVPDTRTYTLDPAASWLYVVVYYDRDRWTPVTAHDHGVRATDFDGTVVWPTSDASLCEIDISFPVTALRVDPPGMREREGLPADGAIEEGTKKTVIKNMKGKKNLQASVFPEISFTATSCQGTVGQVQVTGNLSIRGVSKEVRVPVIVKHDEGRFSANGTFKLNHSDFGMSPFTYGPGTPKNREDLKFVLDLVGTPQ